MGKYGTNLEGFGAFEGGVNADKGAPLVSTNSDGQTALLFGPAALREIQAGVANGDFAIPPDAAGDTITESNPLPYWTFTDVNSAGAITAALIVTAAAGSGNVLRFTVASGTLTGKSATLTRYVPVASSASRSFSYYTEATFVNGTNSAQAEVTVSCQYYKQDGVTTTGTAFSSTNIPFSDFSAPGQVDPLGVVVPDIFGAAPDLTPATAPSDAAFIKLTITIATVATQSAARTLDLTEVRLGFGSPEIILTDKSVPADPPAVVYCTNGSLYAIAPGEIALLDLGDFTTLNATTSIELTAPDIVLNGDITGAGVTTDLHHGITLQRTTNLTVNTSLDASATAITWSSAVKNTSLYAYWSSGSTISIPLDGWYSINCHLISGTGLGTGFAFRLYALVNGVVIAETETQAGANTTSDTFSISTLAYMSAGNSLVFRASASSASKTIGGSRRSVVSIVYLGNTSA